MKTVYTSLCLLFLSACATSEISTPTPQELAADKGYALGNEVDKIYNYRIDGWQHVSSRALIINGGPSTKYMLTLKTSCHNLSSTEVIGYTTTTNNLTRLDGIIVNDRIGGIEDKCYIDRMYEITKIEE